MEFNNNTNNYIRTNLFEYSYEFIDGTHTTASGEVFAVGVVIERGRAVQMFPNEIANATHAAHTCKHRSIDPRHFAMSVFFFFF